MDLPQPPPVPPYREWNEPSDWKDHGPAWRQEHLNPDPKKEEE